MLSYPDENSYDPEQESHFLEEKTNSPNGIEIVAIVNGRVVGTAGIEAVGTKYKVRHRAKFGISVLKEYWGLGLGKALTRACIECAREARMCQRSINWGESVNQARSFFAYCPDNHTRYTCSLRFIIAALTEVKIKHVTK